MEVADVASPGPRHHRHQRHQRRDPPPPHAGRDYQTTGKPPGSHKATTGPTNRRSGYSDVPRHHNGRGDRTRTGGMDAPNWSLTRCDSHDAAISATSWGLSGAEIPACEPVAPHWPLQFRRTVPDVWLDVHSDADVPSTSPCARSMVAAIGRTVPQPEAEGLGEAAPGSASRLWRSVRLRANALEPGHRLERGSPANRQARRIHAGFHPSEARPSTYPGMRPRARSRACWRSLARTSSWIVVETSSVVSTETTIA